VNSVSPSLAGPRHSLLSRASALYVLLPDRLVVGPHWLLPVLVALPLAPLSARRHRHPDESAWIRHATLGLVALVTLANVASMVLLVHHLLVSQVSQVDG